MPHIFAASNKDLFYAFGRAQMQNQGNLLLSLYGQARGRAAEYWGQGYLSSDQLVRTLGFPQNAQHWYDEQTPEFRSYIAAFVAGINDYASQHPDQIADQYKVVLPVQVTDVLAHVERILSEFTLGDCTAAMSGGGGGKGSNGWAIGPAHSASGNAMLLANPHLPWNGDFTFMEAQMVSPSISAYGSALVGFPVLMIAFNNYISWTHTVNSADICDRYALTISGSGYLFDGAVKAFGTETQTLLVKQNDGTLVPQQLVIRHSVQGPVFLLNGGNQLQAIAIRAAGLNQFPAYGALQEWWDMARSKNLQDFQSALKRLQIPTFNVIYAGRDGHVMYLYNGEVPQRPSGDLNYWQGVIPGDTSSTLWTTLLPYSALPKIIDPPSDWVQNSNDPPWVSTFPQVLDPNNYPPYIVAQGMGFRDQRGVRMLTDQNRLSFEQMETDLFSSHMELADRLLDQLITAARASDNTLAKQAAGVLQAWDRSANADSKGAVLFQQWVIDVFQTHESIFAVQWDPANPRTTPSGLADPTAAVNALAQAAQDLLSQHRALDVPWGDVYRMQRGNVNLPASGAPGDPLGVFRVLGFQPQQDGTWVANGGDSYMAIVEFSTPLRARVLLTYGNSSQPGSPHNGDQLNLYAHNQMRDALLTVPEIMSHLETIDAL
ncbi:7-beta-(4-carbaxybutanamido)cephalosporanic acid acylase [Ktedonobacteria bacterium brp13]|nr:7-beta-(4-carbaxybutanamido)cephalosporanic acid acylase [Ktedonobacteria bacterium brp13]